MNAITLKWGGIDLHASRDAWFNATEIAEAHGKEVYEWLRLSETKRYIAALCRLETDKEAELKPGKSRIYTTASFVKTGGVSTAERGCILTSWFALPAG